jgi:hypothetical protein
MSIQRAQQKKIVFLILEKLYFIALFDFFTKAYQMFNRSVNSNSEVFLDYYNSYTHPFIKKSYFSKKLAPYVWSNFNKSKIIFTFQAPRPNYKFDKDIVIDPNDHILALASFFGAKTPAECLKMVPDIKCFLGEKHVKAILISGIGLREQFIHYFGYGFEEKLKEYRGMRVVPKFSIKDKNSLFLNHEANFLCISADYKVKAIEILIIAWQSLTNRTKLTIVCDFLPENLLELIELDTSINFIKAAPLDKRLKQKLLKNSSISILLTHIDGGATLNEGLGYGHALIVNECNKERQYIANNNGFIIPFKNKFYEPGRYGVEWNSQEEYLKIVDNDFKKGEYNSSIIELSRAFTMLIDDPKILRDMRIKSLELAHYESVSESNKDLKNIFKDIVKNKS